MQLLPAALSVTGTAGTAAMTVPAVAGQSMGLMATLAPVAGTPGLLGMGLNVGNVVGGLSAFGGLSGLQGYGSLAFNGLSAYQQYNQGKAQQYALEAQAANEKIKAEELAIERRERLIDALALQTASTGARGIQSVGTPQHIKRADYEKFRYEDNMAKRTAKITQQNLKQRGKNARTQGMLSAGMSLLDTATTYNRIG